MYIPIRKHYIITIIRLLSGTGNIQTFCWNYLLHIYCLVIKYMWLRASAIRAPKSVCVGVDVIRLQNQPSTFVGVNKHQVNCTKPVCYPPFRRCDGSSDVGRPCKDMFVFVQLVWICMGKTRISFTDRN